MINFNEKNGLEQINTINTTYIEIRLRKVESALWTYLEQKSNIYIWLIKIAGFKK